MSEIIRRKQAVPVEARRVEGHPDVINIPGAGPIHVPPAAPGVTQNIIYVNVPQGQAPPQPQAAPQQGGGPREVHYHTTNHYQSPKRRRVGRGTSFLGTLGLVIGGVAAGVAYLPPVAWLAKPISVTGFGCAAFGLIGAVLFNRVGKLMPLVGMVISAVGYYAWLKNTGQPMQLAKVDLNFITQPASTPASPVVPANTSGAPAAKAATPTDNTRLHDHSIFGDGNGTWTKPADDAPPTAPAAPAPISPARTVPQMIAPVQVDVSTAAANLEQARVDAAARMKLDYAGAKAAADAASSQYQQAKIAESPGSPVLINASKTHMNADSLLNQTVIQLRSDPSVASAEAALKRAKAAAN